MTLLSALINKRKNNNKVIETIRIRMTSLTYNAQANRNNQITTINSKAQDM